MVGLMEVFSGATYSAEAHMVEGWELDCKQSPPTSVSDCWKFAKLLYFIKLHNRSVVISWHQKRKLFKPFLGWEHTIPGTRNPRPWGFKVQDQAILSTMEVIPQGCVCISHV